MDQGTNGVGLRARSRAAETAETGETAEEVAERLEQKADALRENLSGLVSELDHRRRGVRWRIVKPVAGVGVVVTGVAVVALGVAAAVAWRRVRRARRRAARRARAR